MIDFDKEEQALIKQHCLQCSIKNRLKVESVRCKEITRADQTERVNSDSESSLLLLNLFPLTTSKPKSKLPPQKNDKETSFLNVDWTNMYKDDRLFGSVYHKVKGDKPYNSEETADFKIQGDKLFLIRVPFKPWISTSIPNTAQQNQTLSDFSMPVKDMQNSTVLSKSIIHNSLAHANCTLFFAPNAHKRTGSQQGKKTIFFGCLMDVILRVVK